MSTRLSISALALAAFFFSFSTHSVQAEAANDAVRTAQMRLASLGYYVGRYDGIMSPAMHEALRNLQHNAGMPVTGELTVETYAMLTQDKFASLPMKYAMYPWTYNGDGTYRMTDGTVEYIASTPIRWDAHWSYYHKQTINSRFANIDMTEQDLGSAHHYAVLVNGHTVLMANNQPYVLRASQTFKLNREDAVMFTAYNGEDSCTYKNYLLVVHGNGTMDAPHEVGNCGGGFEAHVADNALMISFPETTLMGSLKTWDTWRFQDDQLAHI